MSEPIISVSGLRGIVGESLTPEVVVRYVAAFVAELPPGPIVVTRDGRTSGALFAALVGAALNAAGRDVLEGGIAATPTTGVLVRQHGAAGGIQISASHNPPEYNGLKLFHGQGGVLFAEDGQRVLDGYRLGRPAWAAYPAIGRTDPITDTLGRHLDLVLAQVDVPRIRERAFRVLVDANHGAGSRLARPLLEALGCRVEWLGAEPDGRFAHPPEPTLENLRTVSEMAAGGTVDVGFCQDPDADRLALLDERGRYLGEECTLALCLEHVLRHRRGTVVVNCATSRMCADVVQRHGSVLVRAPVGEANVVRQMQAHDAVFGGEGNGGPIDPRVGYVRDSFVGMALLLDALAARGLRISQLAAELPHYAIVKTKAPLANVNLPDVLAAISGRFPEAAADRQDGLRLDWPDRWLLVRGSNTEPIVRFIAEAPTAEAAEALCHAASAAAAGL